jgi:hypothetical protein
MTRRCNSTMSMATTTPRRVQKQASGSLGCTSMTSSVSSNHDLPIFVNSLAIANSVCRFFFNNCTCFICPQIVLYTSICLIWVSVGMRDSYSLLKFKIVLQIMTFIFCQFVQTTVSSDLSCNIVNSKGIHLPPKVTL